MDHHLTTIAAYFDGFRAGDHAAILALLTEDVVWNVVGVRTARGLEEFDSEIENPAFEGRPVLTVEREFLSGDVVVTAGTGVGHLAGGEAFRFSFSDWFEFRGDLIARVDSYIVPL
jgi:ketosteroid isomerase-like protein